MKLYDMTCFFPYLGEAPCGFSKMFLRKNTLLHHHVANCVEKSQSPNKHRLFWLGLSVAVLEYLQELAERRSRVVAELEELQRQAEQRCEC